jgi:hypothetical protein
LLENTAEQLTIGMDMEVVFEVFRHQDGNEIINFAFKGAK